LGPYFFVGCHRMSENSGVGLHRFHCTFKNPPKSVKHNINILNIKISYRNIQDLQKVVSVLPNIKNEVSSAELCTYFECGNLRKPYSSL